MATPTEVAGRYRVDGRLGAGGMSTVFLAMDSVLERPVAVKLLAEHLAEDEDFVARFRREALAAARLQHPNIVQVFDSGEDPGSHRHYIVMEYVQGPSGADLLRDHEQLEIPDAVAIVRDACHGLAYAHRAGVVHRDVKPGNLLLADETGTTKLADFGIAKAAEQTRITQVGSVLGTAAYLSPEQARGDEAGPPSDIYSLGVCAYQFLTGRLPHEYSSLTELALKQQQNPVEPITVHRPEVPPALDRVIRVCLERDPADRYTSTIEMAQALDAGAQGEDTEATLRLVAGAGALADEGGTRALGEATAATQALRTRRTTTAGPVRAPLPARTGRNQPARAAESRSPRKRRLGAFLATLAALAAVAAVAIALLASNDRGPEPISPVDRGDVQRQIDDLRQFLRDNSR
ncbi:MAG: serine/threonine protein kinase [Thermoleophilaceae bacterium]|nr:serine/threonine protein kinase [Thermoleophilaceae bacterium]